MTRTVLTLLFVTLVLTSQSQRNVETKKELENIDSMPNSIDLAKFRLVGLPCPNSSTKAGGPWSYEEAEKRKGEIYGMVLIKKHGNWINPTTGGAIHITNRDEIEL